MQIMTQVKEFFPRRDNKKYSSNEKTQEWRGDEKRNPALIEELDR